MNIREYKHSDKERVIALWDRVFPNSTGHNDPARSIDRKVGVDDRLFFVATDDHEAIVGMIMAGFDGCRGWLYSVAVDPSHQRHGIGTALVRHAEQALQSLGCPKVNLQVRGDNTSVLSFYESVGYSTEDRVSMGKRLPDAE